MGFFACWLEWIGSGRNGESGLIVELNVGYLGCLVVNVLKRENEISDKITHRRAKHIRSLIGPLNMKVEALER